MGVGIVQASCGFLRQRHIFLQGRWALRESWCRRRETSVQNWQILNSERFLCGNWRRVCPVNVRCMQFPVADTAIKCVFRFDIFNNKVGNPEILRSLAPFTLQMATAPSSSRSNVSWTSSHGGWFSFFVCVGIFLAKGRVSHVLMP